MIRNLLTWLSNICLAFLLVYLAESSVVLAADNDSTGDDSSDNRRHEEVLIPLSGTAVIQTETNLSVEPAIFDTGLIDIGQTSTSTVTLTHSGSVESDPIHINEVSVFGVSADEFSIDAAGFLSLDPGGSLEMTITFSPMFPGKKSAGVRMNIEGSSSPYVIMISGSARYPLTSDLVPAAEVLELGEALENVSVSKSIKLSNNSEESDAPVINLISASVAGDTPEAFSVAFAPNTLVPGQTMALKITMNSGVIGHKSAVLTIEHDGNNGPVKILLSGDVVEPKAVPVNFTTSELVGASITRGTSLQFGPDGKLYVAQMDGKILVYGVQRVGKNNYKANLQQTISAIYNVKNHNDDGSLNGNIKGRLLTGILITGTAANPVIYAQSSDPRQGGGPSGLDKNLDTNSGILHKLVKTATGWNKFDLIRGLPRSEENHQGNGMVMMGNKLLLSQGGHTNQGAPSNNFAKTAEFALSAAILEIDLNQIGNNTYDLPTLDDEDRPGANDNNDPFGGNNGKNQAILEANGPVEIYSPGYRNAYDLVLTEAGRLYTIDNGPNAGWGGVPVGNCTNKIGEGGSTYDDGLHYVKNKGYYGGHPNPTRGSKANKFNNSNPQSPLKVAANSVECDFKIPKQQDGALTTFSTSTNGLAEYTASNFGGGMKGNLLTASFGKKLYRIQLNDTGTKVTSKSLLKNNLGSVPLDVIAQGDGGPFPGTIWVVDNTAKYITVFEPADY